MFGPNFKVFYKYENNQIVYLHAEADWNKQLRKQIIWMVVYLNCCLFENNITLKGMDPN